MLRIASGDSAMIFKLVSTVIFTGVSSYSKTFPSSLCHRLCLVSVLFTFMQDRYHRAVKNSSRQTIRSKHSAPPPIPFRR